MANTVSSGERTTASPLVSSIIPNVTSVYRFNLMIFLLNIVYIIFYIGLHLKLFNGFFNDFYSLMMMMMMIMMINDSGSETRNQDIPYVKCPNCAANDIETLVIRGKLCPTCGTPCS